MKITSHESELVLSAVEHRHKYWDRTLKLAFNPWCANLVGTCLTLENEARLSNQINVNLLFFTIFPILTTVKFRPGSSVNNFRNCRNQGLTFNPSPQGLPTCVTMALNCTMGQAMFNNYDKEGKCQILLKGVFFYAY